MADHISLHLHQRWVISDWIVAKQMAKLLGCPLKAFRNYDKLIFPFLLNLSKDLCLVVDYHFVLNKITYGIASGVTYPYIQNFIAESLLTSSIMKTLQNLYH